MIVFVASINLVHYADGTRCGTEYINADCRMELNEMREKKRVYVGTDFFLLAMRLLMLGRYGCVIVLVHIHIDRSEQRAYTDATTAVTTTAAAATTVVVALNQNE